MPWWIEVYLWGLLPGWAISSFTVIRHEGKKETIDNEAIVVGIVLGGVVAMFWPLLIPGYWMWEWLRMHFNVEEDD